MKSMKITLVTVVLSLAVAFSAFAQQKASAPKPGIELGEVVVVTGKVVGVDRTDRCVAVQGPEGNVLVLEVGKAAKNFNQIKVGDQVKLEYYEAVAIYVGAGGKPPQENVAVIATTSPKGQKPAGEVIEVVDVSAVIQAIDPAKRMLTLKGPQWNVIPLKIDKSVKAFEQLKVGESIHVRYTEAVAISVSKP